MVAGVVLEKGSAAPTLGLISIFILVFTGTGVTLKAISICWFCVIAVRLGPTPPSLAVKAVRLEELLWVRIIGGVSGVEKPTFNFVRSIVGAPGASPIENRISLIVVSSVESP